MLGREKKQMVKKERKLKTMESVSGFFFCARIHIRVCLEYHRKDPLAKSRKHIVKKLASKKIKIMQNVAKNKLRRFLRQKICRKTFFLIWTKLANCVKIRQIKIRRRKRHVFAVFCSVDHI